MDLEAQIQLLEKNYLYLFDLYRLGKFEQAVDPDKFQFHPPPHQPADETTGGNAPPTLQPASNHLYNLALSLDPLVTDNNQAVSDRELVAELILRAKILSYEVDDYFLSITRPKSEYFIRLSAEVSRDLPGYLSRHYPFLVSQERRRKILQYLLLGALCGINELYRQHHKDDYQAGIESGRKVLEYIENELPRLFNSSRDMGFGLRGLCHYILGRLSLVLSRYQDAAHHFRQSVENYSERVQIKDYLFKQKEAQLLPEQLKAEREALAISNLVTLRRCALASAFGSAYLALVSGRVREALSLSALSRSALKQDCGKVYAAYTEFIYWSAKRAEASSDPQILGNVRRGLRQCRYIFREYVPCSHYVHRTGIQLAIVYHYLARAYPDRRQKYYKLAKAYLGQACAFAGKDDNGKLHNQRLYAEAAVILSRILSHSEPDKNNFEQDNFKIAAETARRALAALDPHKESSLAKEIDHDISEAHLALGAIYFSKARGLSPDDSEKIKCIDAARWHIFQALEHNKGSNARIQAAGYLRLAELSLLDTNTWPEVRHFYERWLDVKDSVEHDFLHRWAEKIKEKMSHINECLYIDVRSSFNLKSWQRRVEEHILRAAVREVAKNLKQDEQSLSKEKRWKREIRESLTNKCEISKTQADKKIAEYQLEKLLKDYLH